MSRRGRLGILIVWFRQACLLSALLLACTEAQVSGSGKGTTQGEPLLTREEPAIATRYGDVRVWRHEAPNGNVHTGYLASGTNLSLGHFFYVSDVGGAVGLYRANGLGSSPTKITEDGHRDIYESCWSFGLSPTYVGETLYFVKGGSIYRYKEDRQVPERVIDIDSTFTPWAPLRVNDRQDRFSLTLTRDNTSYLFLVDANRGDPLILMSPFVGTGNSIANHASVNPVHDVLMYAHEGSWIRDRVWLYHLNTRTHESLYYQNEFVEVGHEAWFAGGEQVFVVQYGSPARGIPSGIMEINWAESHVEEFLSEQYYLSHAAVIEGTDCYVADTYRPAADGKLKVVLLNKARMEYLELVDVSIASHPAHPHPIVSANGASVVFNDVRRDGRIEVVEVDLRGILEQGFCAPDE